MLSQVNEVFLGAGRETGGRKDGLIGIRSVDHAHQLIGTNLVLFLSAHIAEAIGEEWRGGKLLIYTLETPSTRNVVQELERI